MSQFTSRKFILASAAMIITAAALFSGLIGDSAFVGALAVILGIYGGGNIATKWVVSGGRNSE